jgi:tight adherence protein C
MLAAFTFLVIFLLIGSAGLILFYREAMIQRIGSVISPETKQSGVMNSLQNTGSAFGNVVGQFDRVMPKSEAETSVIQTRLIRAGYRNDSAIKLFRGAKVLVPIVLCLIAFLTNLGQYGAFFVYLISAGLGFLLPDFWLGNRIAKRQADIKRGLPDVLDLLVICIEAGLSLDQATMRTAEELKMAQPAVCDEMSMVVLEQRAGSPRGDAWRHFAERTNVDSVRNLVSVLVQSEKFGTSIAKTLRVHSDTLRTQRRQQVEEQAAKTTVKLVFPLVLFIFPSLFLVTLGPAAIIVADSFKTFFNQ